MLTGVAGDYFIHSNFVWLYDSNMIQHTYLDELFGLDLWRIYSGGLRNTAGVESGRRQCPSPAPEG